MNWPPEGKGAIEQSPAKTWLSRCSLREQGHRERGPSAISSPMCVGAAARPHRGAKVGLHGGILAIFVLPTYILGPHVLPSSGSGENIHSGALRGQEVPGGMGGQWNDALRQQWGWSARRRHR